MSTTTEQEYSAVQEIAARHSDDLIEADQLLREICQAGRNPTFAEMTFFQRECGWNEVTVRDQQRRMANVLRLQAIAGTSADREAASTEAEKAAAAHAKEAPKLEAKISEMQGKLAGLERDQRLSAKRCDEQSDAVSKLRDLVPDHVRESVRSELNKIKTTVGRDISDAAIRVQELECCLDASKYRDQGSYLEMLSRSFPDAVTISESGRMIQRSLSPAWPNIQAGIEAELADLLSKLEPLRAEFSAAIEQAELPLSHYAN